MDLSDSFRMEDLASQFEQILNNKHYSVEVYSSVQLKNNLVQGLMKPYRRPFKLENIRAETVELVFEFYISVRKTQEKLDELATLSKICGYKKGTFQSNNKTFNFHSFLDFATPPSSPIFDYGDYTQCVVITGTCLVTESNGALVANEIETILTVNPNTSEQLVGKLEVLSFASGVTKITESPTLANTVTAASYNKSQSYTYTYNVLLLKDAIGARLLKAARNIEPFGLNEIVKIKDIYPKFNGEIIEAENSCIVVDCSISAEAGAFAMVTLVLQDCLDLDIELDPAVFTTLVTLGAGITIVDSNKEYKVIDETHIVCQDATYLGFTAQLQNLQEISVSGATKPTQYTTEDGTTAYFVQLTAQIVEIKITGGIEYS